MSSIRLLLVSKDSLCQVSGYYQFLRIHYFQVSGQCWFFRTQPFSWNLGYGQILGTKLFLIISICLVFQDLFIFMASRIWSDSRTQLFLSIPVWLVFQDLTVFHGISNMVRFQDLFISQYPHMAGFQDLVVSVKFRHFHV